MTTPAQKKPRRYRSREEWQQLLNEYEQSGLSQKAFCRQHGLTLSNFYQWRQKLKASDETPPHFVEVTAPVADPPAEVDGLLVSPWQVELDLGQGRVIRLKVA